MIETLSLSSRMILLGSSKVFSLISRVYFQKSRWSFDAQSCCVTRPVSMVLLFETEHDATDTRGIKVRGEQKYLYRAVDSTGETIDFLLTAQRDAAAAKRFFRKAFRSPGNPSPRVINVDKNPAYPAAIREMQAEGTLSKRCRLRQ